MEWFFRKLDAFLGAAAIAAAGVAASQGQAFIFQYVQRLGGHLDEAKAQLVNVQTGLRYRLMNDTVRQELEVQARDRVADLQTAYDAIAGANIFTKPLAMLRHADPSMIAGTWRDFVPALPLGADSVTYVIVGMVLGFIAYEIVKLPVTFLLREPRRRRFRRRG